MPIAIPNGTSLNPQAPEAPPEQHELDLRHHPQEGKLWCWAACIHMVLDLFDLEGDLTSQCAIVKKMLQDKDPGHVCPPDFPSRNESCDVMVMAKSWRDCGIRQVIPKDGAMKIEDIKAEIAEGRPVEVGILWKAGGGHAVLIRGWSATSPETLLIADPLRDSPIASVVPAGLATHDELFAAFGHGLWRYTWSRLH